MGDALLDQRLLSGIGNMWKAEILFEAEISPWRPLGELEDEDLQRIVGEAARLMRAGPAAPGVPPGGTAVPALR